RLAQEQYNTLLIAHSENPNILRQYSVLMRDVYGDDRLGIEMLCEADLMEQENKIELLKNEDELEYNNDIWSVYADQSNQQQQESVIKLEQSRIGTFDPMIIINVATTKHTATTKILITELDYTTLYAD
ncbi:MAG: hypothetical protein EZS28_055300, partial [Streblomastix strix]